MVSLSEILGGWSREILQAGSLVLLFALALHALAETYRYHQRVAPGLGELLGSWAMLALLAALYIVHGAGA